MLHVTVDCGHTCAADERFFPSLLPRWLYDTMLTGLIPAPTRKSTSTDFIFVCPDLKSSPAINEPCFFASSTSPGTNVFCGEPLMYVTPSIAQATANRVDGEISASSASMLAMRFSAVSFSPIRTSANRSVLAVHNTMTLSSPFFALQSWMSARIAATSSDFDPDRTLSARDAWFDAMKSGM